MEDFIKEDGFKSDREVQKKAFFMEKTMEKRIMDVFERMYTVIMTTKNPDERARLVDCMIRLYQAVKPEPVILTEKVREDERDKLITALLIADAALTLVLIVARIATLFIG